MIDPSLLNNPLFRRNQSAQEVRSTAQSQFRQDASMTTLCGTNPAFRLQPGPTGKTRDPHARYCLGATSDRQLARDEPCLPGAAGECLSRMRRKSPVPWSFSQDPRRNGEGHALPGATPPSSCCQARCAPLSRWPGQRGQRTAARQSPHIPFFFQNVWSAVRLQVKAETKEESLRKCIRPLLEINISWARMSCARARPNKMDGHRRPF
jgi:hypothetical protein